MSSAKKIGFVAIALTLGLTLFLISDRFKETTSPDQPKKKSQAHTLPPPSKKQTEPLKEEIKIGKEVEPKREIISSKRKQQVARVVQSISPSDKSVSVSKPTVPVLNDPNHNEDLVIGEENKELENNVVNSELPKHENALTKPKGKYFKFQVSSPEASSLPAVIHSVDFQKGRELAAYKTNTYVDILTNKKSLTLVCGVFGYKIVDKVIDYNNPSLTEGAYQDEQGAWVIPYILEPLAKGDISVMYNVGFYKDAVVMLPQSKRELDQLVNMMQLNPQYAIKIHGHCNGNNGRKIIALGDSKNYFDINGSHEVYGSAKQLSAFRADAIRSYLIENGIEPGRLKTQAWGGSDQLVDRNSPSAKLNDRIEIEILENVKDMSAQY
jgi:outer membrane protein OmpA-like peptidoglycan-associated protein